MTVTQIMKKRKRVFFCAHNESLWGPKLLFWTPLTFIVWAKNVFNILCSAGFGELLSTRTFNVQILNSGT